MKLLVIQLLGIIETNNFIAILIWMHISSQFIITIRTHLHIVRHDELRLDGLERSALLGFL